MNDKEYTYDIDKYTIGVDENGEDGIGLTVAKVENGEICFLGNCYGENARCLDLLIKENQQLKLINKEYERLNKENGRGFKITNVQEYNIDELLSYKKYKDNWNKLKKWLRIKDILANSKINPQSIKFKDLLKHMEYLEKER